MQIKGVLAVVLAMSGVAFAAPWQIALRPKASSSAAAPVAEATAAPPVAPPPPPPPPPPPTGKAAVGVHGPPTGVIKLSTPHHKAVTDLFKTGALPPKAPKVPPA
ncbi:hypothetical protein TWF102_004448 [Orbilia oligospora]|uniref:Uncharacterized protein n=1 Tax=Orbilia oligospora TaxID=2813651 RepID=A0A7C8JHU9_ORBOL|nr:hypothetical protein TWF102_004448 [Orbilia oligospora]KAF3103762.1 hypothetical protein TWF706_004804 [Orbilia oligospora]KAF3122504.1 hypothetical protein TWF594_002797 [Orbilia oligospora]KAF3138812.1 hypothetical protein TWF703_004353 [Orbilia oligospora]